MHINTFILGGTNDYNPLNREVVLSGGVRSQCVSVVALPDEVQETEEFYTLMLTSSNPSVLVGDDVATITILGDNSKWLTVTILLHNVLCSKCILIIVYPWSFLFSHG